MTVVIDDTSQMRKRNYTKPKFLGVKFKDDFIAKSTPDDLRRIQLTNYLCVISILNMLLYVIFYSFVDIQLFQPAIFFLLSASLISGFVIVANNKGYYLLAKILLSVLTPLYMSITATIIFGKAPGFQVYLLLATFIPLFLWSFKEMKIPAIIILLILIGYALIEFLPSHGNPKILLPESHISLFRLTNVAVCFLAAGAAIAAYQFLYSRIEEQLVKNSEELRISQAHKDKVYSIIAHDLRGPFGTISGLTKLFIEEYNEHDDKARLNFLETMHKSSFSMKQLLENLLDWSKMQAGTLHKILTELYLHEMVEESLLIHKEQLLKKEIKTKVDIPSDISVKADHYMLSTILRNLISNAIKFSYPKGLITINAINTTDNINICVKDEGIGLSGEETKFLFDIRNDQKIKSSGNHSGSGLGLLLCKDFIKSHNGEIWIQSEKGKGSEFWFSLPKEKDSSS